MMSIRALLQDQRMKRLMERRAGYQADGALVLRVGLLLVADA